FPGETEEAFGRLMDFVEEQRFDRVGVFTYSREENTPAYDMALQVTEKVKRERRARLMERQAEISLRRNSALVGTEMEVLVEGPMRGRVTRMRGRTSRQAPEIDGMIRLRGEAEPGEFVRAKIVRALTYDLVGDIAGAVA
ncbi:MAG TPA: TRAM domain-containing protein, partial [Candidatus Binataceae bacterium]|nr:TRAM domain-containing protein [Candidatus Binataceae bacterium]